MKLWTDQNFPIIISCAKQLSRWTEVEVRELGYKPVEVTENTVVVRGAMRDVMRLNLFLRTAHRVLVPLLRTTCRNIRDLYQEIVCNLWESWPDFRGDSNTDTWVRRIALNVAVTEVRNHVKQPRFVPLEDWMYDTIADQETFAPPDYYHLLSLLEPDDRALLYLRLDHLSIRDIAETLSTTEAAVKQRLYRLRKKIDTLKQQDSDYE